jgi:hypothetical protein
VVALVLGEHPCTVAILIFFPADNGRRMATKGKKGVDVSISTREALSKMERMRTP